MLVELPVLPLILANIVAWLAIHMGVAWLGTQIPGRHFRSDQWLYRPRSWEMQGRVYQRAVRVNAWKSLLPDGAALFRKGFRKKHLLSRDREYLANFARETCRGEAVHWVVLGSSGLFFLWNPWWAGLVMVAYALVANVPCILVQRHNRFRISRMLASRRP
jgi:glycosyl-4,4'-diaponeurosporenoate acyltransferase